MDIVILFRQDADQLHLTLIKQIIIKFVVVKIALVLHFQTKMEAVDKLPLIIKQHTEVVPKYLDSYYMDYHGSTWLGTITHE